MILVTGAGGKTGQAIVQALHARGEMVRAVTRHATDALPREVEVLLGDLREAALLHRAVQGVRAVYHICPNVSPDEQLIGERLIHAAREAGGAHFVFHSVLHPQAEAMPHHWAKLRVEEMLFASGLPFTILQPTAYMQNILGSWAMLMGQGIYRVPYPVATRLSLVDLHDVAEVAARVLTEPGHHGATYELVGTLPLSQIEIAATLTQALSCPVRAVEQSLADWLTQNATLGSYQRETLSQMFQYYARHGLVGNPKVLGWLLGRAPQSLLNWARQANG